MMTRRKVTPRAKRQTRISRKVSRKRKRLSRRLSRTPDRRSSGDSGSSEYRLHAPTTSVDVHRVFTKTSPIAYLTCACYVLYFTRLAGS
jgi:hypothetical protein